MDKIYRIDLSERTEFGFSWPLYFKELPTTEEYLKQLKKEVKLAGPEYVESFLELQKDDIKLVEIPEVFNHFGEIGNTVGERLYIRIGMFPVH